jgi:ATP-dependent DNA ligase
MAKKEKVERNVNLAPNDIPKLADVFAKEGVKYLVSEKFDGQRCLVRDGQAISRKMLPFHANFQERMKPFLDLTKGTEHIFDCEVFNPDATFQQITSSIAHKDGVPLKLYVFDYLTKEEWEGDSVTTYVHRVENYKKVLKKLDPKEKYAVAVKQQVCSSEEEATTAFGNICEEGGEGVMLRHVAQLYKHGRSTLKETPEKGGGFYKLKATDTIDAIIVGFNQKQNLTDEAKETIKDKDAFGRSKRGHRKGDREEVEEIGSVIIEYDYHGKKRQCNATWVKGAKLRDEMTWKNREDYIGKWVEVVFMPVGMKDALRNPRLYRMRPDKD